MELLKTQLPPCGRDQHPGKVEKSALDPDRTIAPLISRRKRLSPHYVTYNPFAAARK